MMRLAWIAIWLLCLVAAILGLGWLAFAMLSNPTGKRTAQLWEAFSQVANAAFGGNPNMTLSATAGSELKKDSPAWWAKVLCPLLDHVDAGHCAKSLEAYEDSRL